VINNAVERLEGGKKRNKKEAKGGLFGGEKADNCFCIWETTEGGRGKIKQN